MNIKSFFKLVEIQTKVASLIPYLLGTSFALYYFESFKWDNALILFLSMLIFDMTTTAINNYMDYSKAIKLDGFGYEEHNAIVRDTLDPKIVRITIYIMLLISSLLGLLLVSKTNFLVLLIGMACFAVGILYSFGPIPISRTPFGELFSGVTMGFGITFLSIYVNIIDQKLFGIILKEGILKIKLDVLSLFPIFLISIPAICGIANIMLANNICDIDEDKENMRYTLPIYIGKEKALTLFASLYYIGFSTITIGALSGVLPLISLISLISMKPVLHNIKEFKNLQTKKDTFILSVKNFVITNVLYIATIFIGAII